MAEDTAQQIANKDEASEYSASKAPETRRAVVGRVSPEDPRLIPGGAHGSAADVGMSGMNREDVPSGAAKPDQLNVQDSPDGVV
jgi:hypothetical protein